MTSLSGRRAGRRRRAALIRQREQTACWQLCVPRRSRVVWPPACLLSARASVETGTPPNYDSSLRSGHKAVNNARCRVLGRPTTRRRLLLGLRTIEDVVRRVLGEFAVVAVDASVDSRTDPSLVCRCRLLWGRETSFVQKKDIAPDNWAAGQEAAYWRISGGARPLVLHGASGRRGRGNPKRGGLYETTESNILEVL